jgi:DNA-binding LacI/PurR family transcriptional regulator
MTPPFTEKKNVAAMLKSRVDGFIISVSKDTQDYEHFKKLEEDGHPLVFFNRVCPKINTSKVLIDDYQGAFKAVEHLILSGCSRIAHIAGPRNLAISRNRLNGYRDALKKTTYLLMKTLSWNAIFLCRTADMQLYSY